MYVVCSRPPKTFFAIKIFLALQEKKPESKLYIYKLYITSSVSINSRFFQMGKIDFLHFLFSWHEKQILVNYRHLPSVVCCAYSTEGRGNNIKFNALLILLIHIKPHWGPCPSKNFMGTFLKFLRFFGKFCNFYCFFFKK